MKLPAVLPVLVVAALIRLSWHTASAEKDLVHIVKGVVKSVDKDSKTMVVKTADGTEHAIKWTGNTTVAGEDVGDAVVVRSKVSVKYTEKAGEKTAVGVKDLGKATAKAVQ